VRVNVVRQTVQFVLAASCAVALASSVAVAQERATLVLRSGEKVIGELVDLGGIGFTMRVNGSERQVAEKDVAVIDFSGDPMTEADWARFRGTCQIVLRNGQIIDGTLYDIAGTAPMRLTIRTPTDERQIGSNEVARIIMARPGNTGISR